ncbi:hypothetical protein VKT23_010791 [Stygiomarasmius scandens]|uniref:Transcription factor domain-containing protein n=1 Tax=Marasmiellus scandens TaxID=2682957 RepID=A0ABR1JEX1_9AGAR
MVMTLLESNRRLEERLRHIEDTTKYSPTHSRSSFATLDYPTDPVDGIAFENISFPETVLFDNGIQKSLLTEAPSHTAGEHDVSTEHPVDAEDWSANSSSPDSRLTLGLPSSSDHLTKLRLVFLNHSLQLGLSLTSAKVEALQVGDLSGRIIHPVLVHISHLWGCIYAQPDRAPSPPLEEKQYLQAVLDLLPTLVDRDLASCIQAHYLIAMYFYFKLQVFSGREFLLKAIGIIRRHDLHVYGMVESVGVSFLDGTFSQNAIPLDALNEDEETRNAILQLIFIDRATEMLLKLPSLLPQQLSDELKQLRNLSTSSSMRYSIPVTRAVSIDLLCESQRATAQFVPELTSFSSWFHEHAETICQLQYQLSRIKTMLMKITLSEWAHGGEVVLKQCAILCAAGLSSILGFFSTITEWRRQSVDYAVEVVDITATFTDEDFDVLDPMMSLCWTITTTVLSQEQEKAVTGLQGGILHVDALWSMLALLHQSVVKLRRYTPYTQAM